VSPIYTIVTLSSPLQFSCSAHGPVYSLLPMQFTIYTTVDREIPLTQHLKTARDFFCTVM